MLCGRLTPPRGFVVLFYWAYWMEHVLIWGDPRFGLAVYPILVAVALPSAADARDSATRAA